MEHLTHAGEIPAGGSLTEGSEVDIHRRLGFDVAAQLRNHWMTASNSQTGW
jgi:hypothetical protein